MLFRSHMTMRFLISTLPIFQGVNRASYFASIVISPYLLMHQRLAWYIIADCAWIVKLQFAGQGPEPIRAWCRTCRHFPAPLGIVTATQITVCRTGVGAPSPPSLREVDSPKAKTEGVSYRWKGHSPSQKSKIFASPLKEGAKGSFAAELPDKFQFVNHSSFGWMLPVS